MILDPRRRFVLTSFGGKATFVPGALTVERVGRIFVVTCALTIEIGGRAAVAP